MMVWIQRPGRGDTSLLNSTHAVFDVLDVPVAALHASNISTSAPSSDNANGGDGDDGHSVSVAVHCLNQNSAGTNDGAWLMLEAEVYDALGNSIAQIKTSSTAWYSYNADSIYTVGMLDTGSENAFINENIDGRSV